MKSVSKYDNRHEKLMNNLWTDATVNTVNCTQNKRIISK